MPKKMMKMERMRKPKFRKMEPIEPLPSKDDYMNDIESELDKYETKGYAMNAEPLYREDVDPDGSDIEDMKAGRIRSTMEPMDMDLPEPMEPIEYVGPGSPRRKRFEEQMQTEKDAAPMRTLRAAKEGFIEGAKEGVSNIKKTATAVAEGTGIPAAYRAARSAVKSVGKMASGTNRAKSAAEDPALKELSEMMGAGVITEGDLTRYRKAMKSQKGSMK